MDCFQKTEDKQKWQGLLTKALFKTFFHQLDWESFLERQFGWLKFERYVYKNELLLSLARCRIFGKEKLISHPFCEYGGPLPLRNEIDFERFRQDLLDNFKTSLKIKFHPILIFSGFFTLDITKLPAQRESYSIDMFSGKASSEGLWRNLRKSTRQNIIRAQKAGLLIEECRNSEELRDFYKLYLAKTKQHKVPAYPYSFFTFFLASPDAEFVLAKKGKIVVAGSVFLKYAAGIHYFINASDASFQGANHLILWSQIKKYCGDINIGGFDLGGTRVNSPLSIFKGGWNDSGPLPIYELKNYQDDLQGQSVGFARKIWGMLPLGLIEKLSPYMLKYKV